MSENTNDSSNPVLTFEGKKYLINELSDEIKESIKVLQIAETQLKMHQDTLKLLSISRNSLANQLREKLKNLDLPSNKIFNSIFNILRKKNILRQLLSVI